MDDLLTLFTGRDSNRETCGRLRYSSVALEEVVDMLERGGASMEKEDAVEVLGRVSGSTALVFVFSTLVMSFRSEERLDAEDDESRSMLEEGCGAMDMVFLSRSLMMGEASSMTFGRPADL